MVRWYSIDHHPAPYSLQLSFLAQSSQETWFDLIGTILVIEAYSIIASLFILIGLRYLLGIKRFKERMINHNLRHFVMDAFLLSVVLARLSILLLGGEGE